MDDDWETAAEETIVVRQKIANLNKWAGEDDDEDVKDSWEDDEKKDEEKDESPPQAPPEPQAKKPVNKTQQAKLNEKDRSKREEEPQPQQEVTPEERLANKLRLHQIEKESDLKSALDTFGVTSIGSLDAFNPVTKEEFKQFSDAISTKVSLYRSSTEFPNFVEELLRSICANLSAAELKKIKITVESLHSEKQKMEKQNTKKPPGKGKSKVTLRMDQNITEVADYKYDYEYDDFM